MQLELFDQPARAKAPGTGSEHWDGFWHAWSDGGAPLCGADRSSIKRPVTITGAPTCPNCIAKRSTNG